MRSAQGHAGTQYGLAIRSGRAVAKIELAITMQPATNMIVLVNIETLPPGNSKPVTNLDADETQAPCRA